VRSLPTFAAGFAGLFGGELMTCALFVRRATAFGGDFALPLVIHPGKATTALVLLIATFSHLWVLVFVSTYGASDHRTARRLYVLLAMPAFPGQRVHRRWDDCR
jgi:hypothetical protein